MFSAALDITRDQAADLKAALLVAARDSDAVPTRHNGFGQMYEIVFSCAGPSGSAPVLSAWIVLDADPVPQRVTCYPA